MGAPRRFSPTEEIEIAASYRGGMSIEEIARVRETIRSTITGVLKRQGVEIQNHKHALTPEQEPIVVTRFNAGETAREIAKDFPVDHTHCNCLPGLAPSETETLTAALTAREDVPHGQHQ